MSDQVIARRVLIVGLPQHGKTFLAEQLVDGLLLQHPGSRALIWDGVREVQYRGQVCETLDDWRQYPRARRLVFRAGVDPVAVATLALELARAGAARRVRVVLVQDELALRSVVHGPNWAHQVFRDATGKARGVDFVCTGQQPRHAPVELRGVLTDLYSFRLDDQLDLDALCDRGMPQHYLERVRRLTPYHFVHYRRW